MILEINAKRETHQHHPTPCYGLCKPATLWFLVAFGSSLNAVARRSCFWSCTCFQPEGTMFLQQFFWLVQETHTYYIDEPRKSTINRISLHIVHLTSPIPPAFALVLQPKRHFCFLRSSETQEALRQLGCPGRLQTDIRWNWVMVDTCWHHFDQLWFLIIRSVFLQIGVPQNDLVFHPWDLGIVQHFCDRNCTIWWRIFSTIKRYETWFGFIAFQKPATIVISSIKSRSKKNMGPDLIQATWVQIWSRQIRPIFELERTPVWDRFLSHLWQGRCNVTIIWTESSGCSTSWIFNQFVWQAIPPNPMINILSCFPFEFP